MHNTYFSSAIGFRSKGSLSISLNDYYCVLNERTERLSSSSCTCCAFSIHGVPINPRFLYGSRQSTLIHWSASRRLILGGLDRYCRLPIYDLDQGCHGIPCSLKERSITRRRRRRVGRFGCMGSEEKNEKCNSGIDGSTEAMLSLLSEDVCGKFVRVGEWIGRSASGRVLVEKRGRIVDECLMEEKEQAESNSLERNSKSDFGSATIKLRDECNQWAGRRENSSSRESRGEKKVGSSCSSYYSMSASGDIESDADVQIRHREFDEESSIDYKRNELRRNKEGVLVREDKKQFKRHEEHVGGYREALARRNASVETYATENAVEWDLRNKAEKKRTEELVGKIGSREKYSQKFSKGLELHESGLQRTSSYHKQFNEREEVSTSARNSVKETAEHDSQRGVLVNEQSESRRKSQQVKKMSEIHASDFPTASSSEKQFSGREKNLNSAVTLVQEARERNVEQIESRRKSQQLTEVLETNDSERETNSASQMHFETRMKNTEENSTSVWSSVQKANERQTQSDQRVFGRTESRRDSQYLTNTSVTSAGDAKTITSSQTPFEARISNREGNLTSVVDLVQEDRERNNQTGERVIEQVGPRKEFQRAAKVSSFRNSTVERDHSSQAPLNLVPQTRVQQMHASTEDEKKSQVMVTPPPSQSVVRGSTDAKPTSGYATIKVSGEFSESSSSALLTHPQGKTPASLHEVDSETRSDETYGEHSRPMVHEDVLSSANQFQKSSTQFVGEFVEKLQDQVLTAEIQKERSSSETTSVYKDKKNIQQGSRRSSDVSGTKGPTDEMWDVVDPSLQEPARIDAPEEGTPTTGSAVVRKTNKSLWSIIADIVRLRWGARAETNNSAVKSGGRSSSNESVSSEAWFSGYEPDENDNENVKRGRRSTPKESRPAGQLQLGKALTRSQREASEATISPDRISQIEADTSSYSGALERFTPSQGASSASREENYGWKEAGKRGQDFPSTIATVESSSPLPSRQLIRSPVIEQKPESGKDEVFRSGFKEQLEQPIQERLIEVSGTEGKDGELKRRKLQRNKQVLVERFDEWEEAYKLETEQRKNDEMFMREALLEAKKAADTWEVPVGAVLVQHGKIIARGCNLVEELRDSTAHAEMICIREASNLLRTWRLAETTLYVTLEPCPMCAGAILQARIDTVVWGAPNKLLGADGSWVRLFPGGGGGSGSDLTNQPAGPIHPFHPNMTIRRGVLATECADVMQQFFQLRRRKKEKKPESPSPPQSLPISSHPSKFLSKMHGIFNIMFCL